MAYILNWKYKNLKFKKVKQHSCACRNCDYFCNDDRSEYGTCLLDESSTHKYLNTCNCFAHEEFKIGDKVQVPYKGKIVDTEIVEISKSGNYTTYITTVGNNNLIQMKFFPKEIKKIEK